MTEEVRIRRAAMEDREAVGQLWLELMTHHAGLDPEAFRLADDALAQWYEIFEGRLVNENSLLLVAEAGGQVVGFIKGSIGEDGPVLVRRPYGYVGEISVTARYQRHGVGKRLYEALVARFRERGFAEIRLQISAHNPVSDAFWRAMGFSPYLLHMRCPLDPAAGKRE